MSNHPIVHVEFSSKDRRADSKFYSEAFGWKIEHTDEINYSTFDPGSIPGGGFAPIGDNMPAGATMVHIETDDIDASLAKVVALGGMQLLPKTEIPGIGWFGLFMDLSGNTVGLYTPLPRSG
jgi:uncharacterized protein